MYRTVKYGGVHSELDHDSAVATTRPHLLQEWEVGDAGMMHTCRPRQEFPGNAEGECFVVGSSGWGQANVRPMGPNQTEGMAFSPEKKVRLRHG